MPAKKAPTFEQALERLETIASGLEDGSMSLEESLKAYEEGVALIRACEKNARIGSSSDQGSGRSRFRKCAGQVHLKINR